MRKAFICSLCHNGIIGGGIYIEDTAVAYKTNKLTVDKAYRNLVMPLNEIRELTWKWIVFPVATFSMKNGTKYSFIIFAKHRFNKYYNKAKTIVT